MGRHQPECAGPSASTSGWPPEIGDREPVRVTCPYRLPVPSTCADECDFRKARGHPRRQEGVQAVALAREPFGLDAIRAGGPVHCRPVRLPPAGHYRHQLHRPDAVARQLPGVLLVGALLPCAREYLLVRFFGDGDLPGPGLPVGLRHCPVRRHAGIRPAAGGGHELLDQLSRAHLLVAGDPRQQGAGDQAAGLGGASTPVPQILFNSFATTLGMVHILIPYMIMSIYAAMQKIDPNHLRAAASLGATPFQGFRTVFLPLSLPGVVNGCTLVFIICLGFYVHPRAARRPRDQMIAGLIGQQIEELLEWGFASAMAAVLLATTMVLLAIYNRLGGPGQAVGMSAA